MRLGPFPQAIRAFHLPDQQFSYRFRIHVLPVHKTVDTPKSLAYESGEVKRFYDENDATLHPTSSASSLRVTLRAGIAFSLAFYAALYFGIRPLFWLVQVIGRAL
ncbi:MAG TPA: hypothetical protein VGG45_16345 [Terracidiphilus sp.]